MQKVLFVMAKKWVEYLRRIMQAQGNHFKESSLCGLYIENLLNPLEYYLKDITNFKEQQKEINLNVKHLTLKRKELKKKFFPGSIFLSLLISYEFKTEINICVENNIHSFLWNQ